MKAKQNKFCIKPFNSVFLETDGSMSTCCAIKSQKKYNFKKHTFKDFWDSDDRKTLVKSFLEGKQPKECSKCWYDEERGFKSERQFANWKYGVIGNKSPAKYLELLEKNDIDHPEDYNLNITNLCNLKCYMCTGWYSSKLLVENNDLGIQRLNQDDYDLGNDKLDEMIEQIVKNDVRSITLQGGEPLINPKIINLLEKLSTKPAAKKIKVWITTNGTKCTDKICNILGKFLEVKIIFSIDGVGRVNDYLRFPSKFDDIKSNLIKYKKKLKDATYMITFTVQNINLLGVKDIIDFACANSVHLKIGILDKPTYLHYDVLPITTKKKALEQLLSVDRGKLVHVTNFDTLVSLLKSSVASENANKIDEFKSMIYKRDSYRKIKMKDFVPKLAKDLEEY
jgi:radical SAM protein with 4Fe4S-binding SPASM domain